MQSNASETLELEDSLSSSLEVEPLTTYLLYNGCVRTRSIGKADSLRESAKSLCEYPKRCDLGMFRQ